jgi:ATP-dependent DNA helicase RecG
MLLRPILKLGVLGGLQGTYPGKLPESLTVEQLKIKHRSVPRNRLIADVFFMAGYIEAWGRGIDIMLEGCREYGFPEPIIAEEQDGISVILRKDIYTEDYLQSLQLNKRQIKALIFIKERGAITNALYQAVNSISKPVATKELSDLVSRNLIQREGTTGKGTRYVIAAKDSQRA